jgi:hypothetical protein
MTVSEKATHCGVCAQGLRNVPLAVVGRRVFELAFLAARDGGWCSS